MLDTLISALINAGISLIENITTLLINTLIEEHKSKVAAQLDYYHFKREHLDELYTELSSIINLYPNLSPNDALQYVEYPPGFFHEQFDSVLESLDYKMEDYKEQLHNANSYYEWKNNIEMQMSNIKSSKKTILEIRDQYDDAKSKYQSFCESNKRVFDLYVGEKVKNCLDNFQITINNIFISGQSVGDAYNPFHNRVDIAREKLIDSMRNDLGIYRSPSFRIRAH